MTTTALCVVAVLVGAGTAASAVTPAAIPDTTGVIHSCYATSATYKTFVLINPASGTKCQSGYTALAFNQKGQPGAQGPAGARGPAGAAGPAGPQGPAGASGVSHAYVAFGGPVLLPANSNAVVASLILPAGSYVVQAKATLASPNGQDASCILASGNTVYDFSQAGWANVSNWDTTLPLQAVIAGFPGGYLQLACKGNASTADQAKLTAVAVNAVN